MIIQNRLFHISCVVVLFVVLVAFGLVQCGKAIHFQQLHILHNKYTSQLKLYTPVSADDSVYHIDIMRYILQDIRRQPVACLESIDWFDKAVMKTLHTDYAIALCEENIVAVDNTLAALEKFQLKEITGAEIYVVLDDAVKIFSAHFNKLEEAITKTVDFVFFVTFFSLIVLSLVIVALVFYTTRKFSLSVKEMRETSSALMVSERRNRMLANFDSLTGLPNRNLLLEHLKSHLENAREEQHGLALLLVDVDHFKDVNDSMGLYAGDKLICAVSSRIADCISDQDILARIGGDEFNIILGEGATKETSESIAKKILHVLSEPFDVMGQTVFISASIGIVLYPDADAKNADDMKKFVDLAVHKAKEKGRNSYEFYSLALEHMVKERMIKEQCLRQALARGEFSLHFQPVINLETMKAVSVEALIRWHSRELGVVAPEDFIPLAEETGLIIEIGDWVLHEACRNLRIWRERDNPDLKVAVNVSPKQLLSESLVASIKDALSASQLPPECLDLEITENILVEGGVSIKVLKEISCMGVNLFLDDFGTGHSSLSYLQKLPIDVLKIDRSFVMKLDNPEENTNIIPSIVAMSRELSLNVVAEGVETEESLEALKKLRCECAQGYFLSKPVPPEDIDEGKIYHGMA